MLAIYCLWRREVTRFYRQRDRVVGALATPLLFWLVIGSGFGAAFKFSDSYLEYLYPGIILLSLLFTAIFATISIIEDRREGFLQSVLVAPVARVSMVLGKILGATTIAMIQGVAFLSLGPFLGLSISAQTVTLSFLILFLVAFGFSNLGFLIAWRSSSTQGFHAIMNLFLMPMWLLSGAFFPVKGAPAWIAWIMKLNPLTYGMEALRRSLYADFAGLLVPLTVTFLFAFGSLILAAFSVKEAVVVETI